MALSSVLEIVTQACDEMGISRPATVVGSGLPQVRQLLGHLNAAGRDLVFAHEWSALIGTASIETVAGTEAYTLPTDFERFISDTGWNTVTHFPIDGNISWQRYQFLKSSSAVGISTRQEYRLLVDGQTQKRIKLRPIPTESELVWFWFVSNSWVTNSSGTTYYDTVQADADLVVYNPNLMVKELKWRFRAAKGLDANALKVECDAYRDLLIAREVSTGIIDMTGPCGISPIDALTTDGNWDLT